MEYCRYMSLRISPILFALGLCQALANKLVFFISFQCGILPSVVSLKNRLLAVRVLKMLANFIFLTSGSHPGSHYCWENTDNERNYAEDRLYWRKTMQTD